MTGSPRELAVDATAAGACAVVGVALAGAAEQAGRLTGDEVFWGLVLGFAGCVALLWRRRHPVAVAAALAALSSWTEAGYAAMLVAVCTVASRRSPAAAAALAAVSLAAQVPYTVQHPDPDLSLTGATIFNAVSIAIAVLAGWVVRGRRQRAAALREEARRAEQDAVAEAERLRLRERARIAREMHDVLAHRISLVSLYAGALEFRPDLTREEIARSAAAIRAGAHQALEDLREILGVLRAGTSTGTGDDGLRPQPGLADLAGLVEEARAAGTTVTVEDRLHGVQPPPLAGRTAYRIVQEGLTNARKHAAGATVRVCLDRAPGGELRVCLRNPLGGRPGTAVPGARAGLIGLAERVALAGGRLDHGVRRDPDGTAAFHLEAWLPWSS